MERRAFSRRDILLASMVTFAGGLLAACQPRVVEVEKTVEVEKIVKQTIIVEKISKEPVTIRPVVMQYSWNQGVNALRSDFIESHPHIKLEDIVVPDWAEYPGKVAAMFAAHNLGDVIEYNAGPDMNAWAHKGVVRPLEELVQATDFDINAFFESGLAACTHNEHLVAIPAHTHPGTVVCHYNKNLLDEAGVPYPTSDWDYEQFVDVALKLTQDSDGDGKTDVFGVWPFANDPRHLYPVLRSNGGQWYDPTCHKSLVDQPPSVQTLQDRWDLIFKYKVMPLPGASADAEVLYRSGKLAMRTSPAKHCINLMKATETEFPSGSCLIPKGSSGKVGTATTGVSYAMTTTTSHPQEAWEYMEWLSSAWFGINAMIGGYIDAGGRKDVWADPQTVELWSLAPEIAALFENAEAEEVPWNLRHQEINSAFNGVAGEIFANSVSVEEGVKRITRDIDNILAKPII